MFYHYYIGILPKYFLYRIATIYHSALFSTKIVYAKSIKLEPFFLYQLVSAFCFSSAIQTHKFPKYSNLKRAA